MVKAVRVCVRDFAWRVLSRPWQAIPLLAILSWVVAVLVVYGAYIVLCWVVQAAFP